MFDCKVCQEKDEQIVYLKEQLNRLLFRLGVPSVEQKDDLTDNEEKVNEDDSFETFGGLT